MADSILFLDVENTSLSLRNHLGRQFDAREVIDAAGGWDRLHDAVAYADFAKVPEAIARSLNRAGYTCRHVAPTGGLVGKDLVDFALTIDLLETALMRTDVRRIVLVGGDGDYVPVVSRAQQLGRSVLVVAVRGALSRELSETVGSDIAMLEGGAALRNGAPHSSDHTIGERWQLASRAGGQ